jgi:hypothetical protein
VDKLLNGRLVRTMPPSPVRKWGCFFNDPPLFLSTEAGSTRFQRLYVQQ